MSIAQVATGHEIILMGDFNIDYSHCSNTKWRNLMQLFELTQLANNATRITETTSSIIDHIYGSNPENIPECFVPFYFKSDHFSVCFTREINCKIARKEKNIQLTLVISNSLISNNRLSRNENLVPA